MQRIVVGSITEEHNCAGKKTIFITDEDERDTVFKTQYMLNPAYMAPHDKLALSTVDVHDEVMVDIYPLPGYLLVSGSYVDNFSNVWSRPPVCKCQHRMVSDGYNLYCRNQECPLTTSKRIERLSKTCFFDQSLQVGVRDREFYPLFDNTAYRTPFDILTHPETWGGTSSVINDISPNKNMTLTDLILNHKGFVSLATFLVDTLFAEFLDRNCPWMRRDLDDQPLLQSVTNFYGHMTEVTQRRSPDQAWQNDLLKQFIWSLGIESLRLDVIEKMVIYEASLGCEYDTLLPYAYLLNRPGQLVTELGVHPLEAFNITQEFRSRQFEMYDIFSHYSSPESIRDAFDIQRT